MQQTIPLPPRAHPARAWRGGLATHLHRRGHRLRIGRLIPSLVPSAVLGSLVMTLSQGLRSKGLARPPT